MSLKYRKKIVEVEAFDWHNVNWTLAPDWFKRAHASYAIRACRHARECLEVKTNISYYDSTTDIFELAHPGDIILFDGEHMSVCPSAVFRMKYEKVNDE